MRASTLFWERPTNDPTRRTYLSVYLSIYFSLVFATLRQPSSALGKNLHHHHQHALLAMLARNNGEEAQSNEQVAAALGGLLSRLQVLVPSRTAKLTPSDLSLKGEWLLR